MRPEAIVPPGSPDFIRRPLVYIEGLIATGVTVSGVYILSPWFEPTNPSAAASLPAQIFVYVLGVVLLLSGVSTLYGLIRINKRKFRMWGLFSIGTTFVFTTSLSVLANGPRPISWMFPMIVGFIAFIIFLRMRYEDKVNAGL